MTVFRTKWEARPETFDIEASGPLEALSGMVRETGKLTGQARVSSVTVTRTEEGKAKHKGKIKTKVAKVETVVPQKNLTDQSEVWELNFALRPSPPGVTLLHQGQRPMQGETASTDWE